MPTVKADVTLAAGAQANLFQGSQYEYLRGNARVRIALLSDPGDTIEGSISAGSDILLSAAQIDEKAATEPLTVFDLQYEDFVMAGERIIVQVRDTSGAGGRVRMLAQIQPV